jgi:hypothetical protein
MKSFCIDGEFLESEFNHPMFAFVKQIPKEGEEYEVEIVETKYGPGVHITSDDFGRYQSGNPVTFRTTRFVLLSDIDEKEIKQQKLSKLN